MMEVTSGEILFRACNMGEAGRSACPEVTEEFWQYLEANQLSSNVSDDIVLTNKAIASSVETYLLKLTHKIKSARKSIELTKQKILTEVAVQNLNVKISLLESQRRFEAKAMQLVLRYYTILHNELRSSKKMLSKEKSEKGVLFKQAKILRDVRMFASHIIVESRGKISFSMLPPDSQQFSRCVKAVIDNVNAHRSIVSGMRDIKTKTKVLNVFKLQNSYLSGKLQAASEKVINGKIKGLFCCLSKSQFYSFSVFGLYAQVLPGKPATNLHSIADDLFSTAWFHAEPPNGLPVNTEVLNTLKVAGSASRLCVQRPKKKPEPLWFSRYSNLTSLDYFKDDELNNGVFLALCRALIVQQKTIAKKIDSDDIVVAMQENYDCLFSSVTEEYILLQPKYVLPEFFIHTRFPTPDPTSAAAVTRLKKGSSTDITNSNSIANAHSLGVVGQNSEGSISSCGITNLPASDEELSFEENNSLGGAAVGTFPLENLLLQNTVHHLQKQQRRNDTDLDTGMYGSNTVQNRMDKYNVHSVDQFADADVRKSPRYARPNGGDGNVPRDALLKKQQIVEELHNSVHQFAHIKSKIVSASMESMASKLGVEQ